MTTTAPIPYLNRHNAAQFQAAIDYHGFLPAGLVQFHRNRTTGTHIAIYDADLAGLDNGDGEMPWYTICEEHSICIGHRTRRLAEENATDPLGWCDECQEAE